MNQLLNQIFGIGTQSDPIGFGTPGAELSFVHPFETWIWAAGIIAIIALSWWSYRSLPGNRLERSLMMAMRSCLLIVLGVLAMGPMLERQRTSTEQDWTLVLVDQSRSMLTPDVANPNPETSIGNITRFDQLNIMLADSTAQWDELSTRKHVQWIGFGDRITPISSQTRQSKAFDHPQGSSTNIAQAIKDALNLARARPISSIILISDGRSFDEIDRELINTLNQQQIPIYAVPMGSAQPIADVEIIRIESPTVVFADDRVPMRAIVQTRGIDPKTIQQLGLQIEIIDHATANRIAISPILPNAPRAQGTNTTLHEVALSFMPEHIGNYDYDIRIVDRLGNPIDIGSDFDLNPTNNHARTTLGVIDRPMRVLYIDGYPRWEQRYLKNLLLRESSITSSSLLLASTRRSIQDGDELITSLPITKEQWEPFDVIILGDVEPSLFSQSQLDGLREHISTHGAGLLWIAGQGSTPNKWFDTPIASLLPLRKNTSTSSRPVVRPWETQVVMKSTPEANRIGLLAMNDQRDGWLDRLSNPQTGWSKLRWALAIDPASLKPGVSILATAHPTSTNEPALPIITMMRYGSGKSIFVGTDEIWRWRYGRGEDLPERFWLPLIRSLGRGTIDRRAAPAQLSIHPNTPMPNQPVQIVLDLFDQATIDLLPHKVTVEIAPVIQQDQTGIHRQPTTLTLQGIGPTRTATWVPDQPGIYEVRIIASATLSQVSTKARVIAKSNEQRQLDTNHALLATLAQETAGQVIQPSAFGSIPDLIPNRARTTTRSPEQVSLWDRPISLIVPIALLLIEWIGRRRLRLI